MDYYAKTFDAIARIEEPGERAEQHRKTVASLLKYRSPEAALLFLGETLDQVRVLSEPRQQLFLLRKIGELFAELGRFSAATHLLEEMDRVSLSFHAPKSNSFAEETEEQKDALLRTIAVRYVESGQWNEVMDALERIVDFDEHEETILDIFRRLDDPEKAASLLALLESEERRVPATLRYAELIRKRSDETAFRTLVENLLETVVARFEDSRKKDAALVAIAESLGRSASDPELWRRILAEITDPAERIGVLLRQEDVEGDSDFPADFYAKTSTTSLSTFGSHLARELDSLNSDKKSADLLRRAGERFAIADDEKQAKKYYREAIQHANRESNAYGKIRSLTSIARSLAESGFRDASEKLYRQIVAISESVDEPHLRLFYLREIAESMIEDHFFDEAEQVIEHFDQETDFPEKKALFHYHRSLAYSRGIRLLTEEADLEQERINRWSTAARESAESLLDPILRSETLRRFAETAPG